MFVLVSIACLPQSEGLIRVDFLFTLATGYTKEAPAHHNVPLAQPCPS